MADEGHGAAVQLPEPRDDGTVVHPAAVAVELDPVVEDPLDVVQGVGPLRMAGELDELPDLVFGCVSPGDRVELLLEPLLLAGDARAVEKRQALQPAEPRPQPTLGLTAQKASADGPGTRAARVEG
jgi:hypothetical protein